MEDLLFLYDKMSLTSRHTAYKISPSPPSPLKIGVSSHQMYETLSSRQFLQCHLYDGQRFHAPHSRQDLLAQYYIGDLPYVPIFPHSTPFLLPNGQMVPVYFCWANGLAFMAVDHQDIGRAIRVNWGDINNLKHNNNNDRLDGYPTISQLLDQCDMRVLRTLGTFFAVPKNFDDTRVFLDMWSLKRYLCSLAAVLMQSDISTRIPPNRRNLDYPTLLQPISTLQSLNDLLQMVCVTTTAQRLAGPIPKHIKMIPFLDMFFLAQKRSLDLIYRVVNLGGITSKICTQQPPESKKEDADPKPSRVISSPIIPTEPRPIVVPLMTELEPPTNQNVNNNKAETKKDRKQQEIDLHINRQQILQIARENLVAQQKRQATKEKRKRTATRQVQRDQAATIISKDLAADVKINSPPPLPLNPTRATDGMVPPRINTINAQQLYHAAEFGAYRVICCSSKDKMIIDLSDSDND